MSSPTSGYSPSWGICHPSRRSSARSRLLIVGLWIFTQRLSSAGRAPEWVLVWLPLLPVATLTLSGFAGLGVYMTLPVAVFLYTRSRQRWLYWLATPIIFWGLLSVMVAYMAERTAIREVVWSERAGLGARLESLRGISERLHWIDLGDPSDAALVDRRLNQNHLVGLAIEEHQRGATPLLGGASLTRRR